MPNYEEGPIELDLNVETLALLGREQVEGPLGVTDSDRPRCCGGSLNTPPTCCP